MSVLIKGMKMPNGCHLCPFANEYDECCINAFLEDQHEITHYCHLIHIPDHGDLVDIDRMLDDFTELRDYDFASREYVVIPAERSEE